MGFFDDTPVHDGDILEEFYDFDRDSELNMFEKSVMLDDLMGYDADDDHDDFDDWSFDSDGDYDED